MDAVEVQYKINTMGAAVFSNKMTGVQQNEVTLGDFKQLFTNRHHVKPDNFR
jgi:hypothetical protein